jgi:hypothetical protein
MRLINFPENIEGHMLSVNYLCTHLPHLHAVVGSTRIRREADAERFLSIWPTLSDHARTVLSTPFSGHNEFPYYVASGIHHDKRVEMVPLVAMYPAWYDTLWYNSSERIHELLLGALESTPALQTPERVESALSYSLGLRTDDLGRRCLALWKQAQLKLGLPTDIPTSLISCANSAQIMCSFAALFFFFFFFFFFFLIFF